MYVYGNFEGHTLHALHDSWFMFLLRRNRAFIYYIKNSNTCNSFSFLPRLTNKIRAHNCNNKIHMGANTQWIKQRLYIFFLLNFLIGLFSFSRMCAHKKYFFVFTNIKGRKICHFLRERVRERKTVVQKFPLQCGSTSI